MNIGVERQVNLQKYIEFVRSVQKGPKLEKPLTLTMGDPNHLEQAVREKWNEYGDSYLIEENVYAHEGTMYMLLKNVRHPAKREKWLSLGSGPGLYETFLVQIHHTSIDCLDLSHVQLKTHQRIVAEASTQKPKVSNNVRQINGSFVSLPVPNNTYDQILNINSLQWTQQWRRAIAEMSRVLNSKKGARVYSVVSSVPTTNGDEQIAAGLDTDTFIDEFEKLDLQAKVIGHIKIAKSQFGLPGERFYGVFERGLQVNGSWTDRLRTGELLWVDYEVSSEGITETNYAEAIREAGGLPSE